MSSETNHPQSSQPEDEAAIRALYTQLMDGWNKGSAEAFAAPFAEDGHLVAFDGTRKELVVHRKGATRAFGPGHPEVCERYRSVGQPVICGGSMETGSYLLVGTDKAVSETFGSTMHGSGRTMSRTAAKKQVRGSELIQQMAKRGIVVKAVSMSGLAEEAGFAYKNISDVVETVDHCGITKKVAELRPVGNIKG